MEQGVQVNVAVTTKAFIMTMMKADPSVSFLALNCTLTFKLSNSFPAEELAFKKYVLIHQTHNNKLLTGQHMAGCFLKSFQLINKLKFNKTSTGMWMTWLNEHTTYIKADTLSFDVIKVIRFIFELTQT